MSDLSSEVAPPGSTEARLKDCLATMNCLSAVSVTDLKNMRNAPAAVVSVMGASLQRDVDKKS